MDSAPVALVTAGSAGLGAATARVFASEGMRVVINYSANKDRAAKLAEELSAFSPNNGKQAQAAHIRADLGKRADIVRLVDETIAVFGRLDVVFSNGGWTRLFLMHAAKKHLEKTKGVFITTASLAGVSVSGSSLAYSVTKAAQIHLVKGLANAAGPNIRVNSVSPGLMLTDWGLSVFSEERREEIRRKTKLQRLVTVEEVADQVMCFVKSKSVTGANAVIDAGQSI